MLAMSEPAFFLSLLCNIESKSKNSPINIRNKWGIFVLGDFL